MAQESSSALFSESSNERGASNPFAASISLPVAFACSATGHNAFAIVSGFSPNVQSEPVSSFSAGETTAPCGDYGLTTAMAGSHPLPDWQDLSSRRARLRLISEPENQVDLSFLDVAFSAISNLERSVPEVEILAHSRIVRNFLDIGLHKLGEYQRLAMISSVSILKTSPEFASSFDLLDGLSTIFSKSDTALSVTEEMIAQQQSFHTKREEKEDIDKEDKTIRELIYNETTIYDTEEEEIKRLEEEIKRRKSKMTASLDTAEMLKAKLLSNRKHSRVLGDQLLNLKDDYETWTQKLHEAENKQLECLNKWEQLRALFR